MSRISISELKRRLPVGQTFTGEFVGWNPSVARKGMAVCRRRVVRQGQQMVCEFLDGPRRGEQSNLGWRGLTAEEIDGAIVLCDQNGRDRQPEAFLKLTFADGSQEPSPALAAGSGAAVPGN